MRSFLAAVLILFYGFTPAQAASRKVIVASKIDTEGALLGNIILILLDRAGIETENRLELGPTAIVRQALVSGAIDLYPEYTGNAAFFFHIDDDPVWRNAEGGYERAKSLDRPQGIIWLAPAPANNGWVIAMRTDVARHDNLRSLTDFSSWVSSGGQVKLAASAEFVESSAGLPAFQTAYGFRLTASQLLVLSGGATSATMKAAADAISGVNAAMAYGTDGGLAALDLVVLDDPKRTQPVYRPAPVIREATLRDYPEIANLLAPTFATLDLATLRDLNEKIAVEGQDPKQVARDFLEMKRLLP